MAMFCIVLQMVMFCSIRNQNQSLFVGFANKNLLIGRINCNLTNFLCDSHSGAHGNERNSSEKGEATANGDICFTLALLLYNESRAGERRHMFYLSAASLQ